MFSEVSKIDDHQMMLRECCALLEDGVILDRECAWAMISAILKLRSMYLLYTSLTSIAKKVKC